MNRSIEVRGTTESEDSSYVCCDLEEMARIIGGTQTYPAQVPGILLVQISAPEVIAPPGTSPQGSITVDPSTLTQAAPGGTASGGSIDPQMIGD
jgi:hypothetical protein